MKSLIIGAVIRDASGTLITSGIVEMKFTIRSGSVTGSVEYQETPYGKNMFKG